MTGIWKQVLRCVELTLVAVGILSIYASMARSAWDWLAGIAG
ncbi:MAG: hypothetical protein AB7E24_00465 [Novosphingobium sp.]